MDRPGEDAASLAQSMLRRKAIREFIPRDSASSFRFYVHDYPHPFATWNYHPEYEVHLILRSSGSYVIGDAVGSFATGQLSLIGPNLPHHWVSDISKGEHVRDAHAVLHFSHDWITALQGAMPELHSLDAVLRASHQGIEFQGSTATSCAEALLRVRDADDEFERVIRVLELLRLLALAPTADLRSIVHPWLVHSDNRDASHLVGAAIDYILENLTNNPRLKEAARRAAMSESSFSRYFRAASGQTFSGMVGKLRLTQASRLLERTDDPVSLIATHVGYGNLSNFNRQFLRMFGMTPREYRTASRQEQ